MAKVEQHKIKSSLDVPSSVFLGTCWTFTPRRATKTMPKRYVCRGDAELGGCQSHAHYHNVYGMLMARSTYEGMTLANGSRRSFVLTRARSPTGISGQPLARPDIGGFAGNATPKLFGRWMGVGAMFQFCRGLIFYIL